MESPIQENELPYKAYMKLKKSVLFEFQNGTIINLEKSVVFQQLHGRWNFEAECQAVLP